jgi:hypothetical protein
MECPLCHKEFKSKLGFTSHVEKKVCIKLDKQCPYCARVFTNKRNRDHHTENKICVVKNKLIIRTKNEDPILTQREKDLCEENIRLKSQLDVLKEHSLAFPKAFGSEQITDILTKLPNLLHDALTKHTDRSVEYLIEQIHCNKEIFPEYINVYMRGYKSPYALVSDGTRFLNKPKKRIIEQIIESSLSMLQEYVDNNGEKCGQKIIDKYERYRDVIENSERRKDIETEIAGMLIDMRVIVELKK